MNLFLLRVVRTVVGADSDPARQALFANLVQSRWSVRVVYRLHERLGRTWGAALLVSCYGLASFLTIARPRNRRARVFVVATHENARRQVDRVCSWIGAAECGSLAPRPAAGVAGLLRFLSAMPHGRLLRVLRILRTIDRRHGFLVSCRAAGALAWYVRAKAILGARRPAAVLVSSDSNPEEVAFVGAARALDIPRVFVSHAYPTPFSPPLDFSLSILEGEAAVRARRRTGPIKGGVLLAGIEGQSAPLDPHRFTRRAPVIGIFTPKAISWPTLTAIVDDCRRHCDARAVVIRWHPSMLEPPQLATRLDDLSKIIESPRTATVQEVAQQCDWVIAAENSNVHLPVLKLGVPTVVVRGLGIYPAHRSDLYGFVANGVIFPPVASIRDIDAGALVAFYSDGWQARFQQYDAAYLGSPDRIASEVHDAIRRLFEEPMAKAAVC